MTSPSLRHATAPEPGFTLVELMIALVVIAIGVIALSGIQTRSSNDVYAAGRQTRALALAQQHVEMERSIGYAAAVSDSGVQDVFTWTARVNTAALELKSVDVTVTWPEHGQSRSVQLSTLISLR